MNRPPLRRSSSPADWQEEAERSLERARARRLERRRSVWPLALLILFGTAAFVIAALMLIVSFGGTP